MDLKTYSGIQQTQQIDLSARKVLFRNVYIWMTLALVITAVTALIVASSPNIMQLVYSNMIVFYGMLIGQLALVWYLAARINKLSFISATMFFILYSVLNGVIMSFIFIIYTHASIASTFFVAAATFGVMALIGTFTKKDLSSWGNILFMALIGLIIASVVNLFLKSPVFYWIITYAGVLLFVGLTIYDSQKIKKNIDAYGNEVNETTPKMALMGA